MTQKVPILICAFISLFSGMLLLLNVEFLQQSQGVLWHIPYRSFITILGLMAVAILGKLIAKQTFIQQSLAITGLAFALSWFPLSLIFSGNVRNIFSANSLVSHDIWLLFSFLPILVTAVLILWKIVSKLVK